MAQNQKERPGDMVSQSFGEGYASRCDEEGFGGTGTLSANQFFSKNLETDQLTQQNQPASFDKTQGSEVKEKEYARNQTKPAPKAN
ncbi:uncharacterized protein G2W53_036474 [Senna tora]|uniref:Uncharacterized protein n=1 Tax=Senna tora TaxID=362788 RepID=A0A834SV35_9FABA|nr:uncharacterized protein G2W53_036474 [Senna tora]